MNVAPRCRVIASSSFDELSSREELAEVHVVTSFKLSTRHRHGKLSSVAPGYQGGGLPLPEGVFDRVDIKREIQRTILGEPMSHRRFT